MESLGAAVGVAIRNRRTAMGLSQEQLGEVAGLDRTYISGVERGVRNPTISSLGRIASALECDLSAILIEAEFSAEQEAVPPKSTNRFDSTRAVPRPYWATPFLGIT
jgi:transcriptional regulator with XRE-family HTH domain